MMRSDAFNWGVAILLSMLAHSMLLMSSGAQMGAKNAVVLQAPLITRLSFNKPLDKTVLDEPRPIKKQQTRPVKKIEPKPVPEKAVKKKQIVQQEKPVEKVEPVSQVVPLEQAQGRQVSHSTDGLMQRERQQYLHKLLSHIEAFKFYPRSARMRSLEGDVMISFVLRSDGSYEQLMVDGKHTALVKAARQAMDSAMPLPAPPKDISVPEQIEFEMVYSLTH